LINYQNIPFLFLGVPIRSTRLVTQISTFVVLVAAIIVSCRRICLDFCALAGSDNEATLVAS
jgi:hypothetical protein